MSRFPPDSSVNSDSVIDKTRRALCDEWRTVWQRCTRGPACRNSPPITQRSPSTPPARLTVPSPASQYYTVLAHYIIIISTVVSTNFLTRVSPSASKIIISMRKVWTYSLAQKHRFEEVSRPYDRINVAYFNVTYYQ